jgi:hypothetical protein
MPLNGVLVLPANLSRWNAVFYQTHHSMWKHLDIIGNPLGEI